MTSLTVTTKTAADLAVDALVLGIVGTDDGAALAAGHGLPRKAVVHLQAVLADLEACGAPDELHRVVAVPGVKATSVLLAGLGKAGSRSTSFEHGVLREAAASALRPVRTKRHVAVALPTPDVTSVAAVADGAWAGTYAYDRSTSRAAGRRGRASAAPAGPKVTVVSGAGQGRAVKDAVARAATVGAARDWARDLVNTPPNLLFPQSFAEAVKKRVADSPAKVTVSVLDEKALAKGGFGGILGVGQGSANPPRIVTMSYSPSGAKGSVALVGKGITFDSGGLNIKPSTGMVTMKCDMAGAAAVAATVLAAAELGGPVAVTGYLCLAENMPGGRAQRPSDVVVMRDGTSVEILDTDAEGRMVLADGLCLASEKSPDWVVDIATLTGAQMIALGSDLCGVMGNDDGFRSAVLDAAETAGEGAWPMPLPASLRTKLDTPTADIAHKGDREGGMLTAGIFLSEFVGEGIPWAHLDIAGPAFNSGGPKGRTPKGGTGFGVSTLVGLVEGHAAR
ncbi:leucyl aminopeptidase [Phycicoccus endophyticus]|uniref:Probable cytosol aminopeptidase n=1 Tax=Phycicoccus endophyticus TaxID=1690220 RepID=A0A7G9R511_9MICO|nr:leucyl aminopeptidase [Phycicoccus endophyticus]NHI20922.1 leucyl aminopeptidase [Phycicoccus endophyticus]QNN50686.1 leucyl aminopeptidase [Phycicoccus endophyticus]GGL22299.1 putative cytosol aminopeptidase [Phycicoccus endophyticus]